MVGATAAIRRGTTALTTAAGAFHIQPTTLTGCLVPNNNDANVCLGSGALTFNGVQRDLRFDTAPGTTILPDTQRLNLFLQGHYDISDSVTAFGELGYYTADTQRIQPPVINLNTLTIPTTNYWNPFGPVTFANGQVNPNRISGLTNVPATGLAVTLNQYRFVDAGYPEGRRHQLPGPRPRRPARRMARLGLGNGPALFGSRGDRRVPRRQHPGAAGLARPVHARRLQPVQRRLHRPDQLRRLHAQLPDRARRHHLHPEA